MITALTAVGALIFTSLSLNATRDQVAVVEQGQFTERYSKGVEQIGQQGADHLQVRLGGVFALERLAHDSARDQSTIVEVLSAFVRTTAPSPVEAGKVCPQQPISPDVQATLTVLGRRDAAHDNSAYVDLENTCLSGAHLNGAQLSHANLAGAHLDRADLGYAHLDHVNLDHADLNHANLAGADLRGSYLGYADLRGAYLRVADLGYAELRGAYLGVADLGWAGLHGAHLGGADLDGARLDGADLNAADLNDANLRGADLRDAQYGRDTVVTGTYKDAYTRGAWW
jgi:hypothetical protein